jgi:hypothetical protein
VSQPNVISLDERRARHRTAYSPAPAPTLRIVRPDDPPPGRVFTLEVFLARARTVMSEPHSDLAS